MTEKNVFITGPDPTLELKYSDVWLPGLWSRRIHCFELPAGSSHEKAIDVVERGLKALVEGTPELGAEAIVVQNAAPHNSEQPWRALVKGKGIEFIVKDMTKTFRPFQQLKNDGFPLSAFNDADFIPVPGAIAPEPQPEAKFQLNLIQGGVLLSVCLYHRLTDGNGMNAITRALGDECKLAASTPGALQPRILNKDRSIMAALHGGKTDLKDHPAHSILDQCWSPNAVHEEAPAPNGEAPPPPPNFAPAYFRLTNDKAQALKDFASRDGPVSTHDAVSALLWRTVMLARVSTKELDPDRITTFTVPHNARRHVGLPDDWIGNCVYFVQAQAYPKEMQKDSDVPDLAARIRKALNTVDRDHMEGICTIRRKDPYSINWTPALESGGPHVLVITSFYHSGLLGYDFGPALGKVQHFTSTDLGALGIGFQRVSFMGPKFFDGRGCDVHTGLLERELEFFKKDPLWNKYFTLFEEGV